MQDWSYSSRKQSFELFGINEAPSIPGPGPAAVEVTGSSVTGERAQRFKDELLSERADKEDLGFCDSIMGTLIIFGISRAPRDANKCTYLPDNLTV
jgi:hypothetical protein